MQKSLVTEPVRPDYNKDNDQHVFAIDRLVQELGLPAEEVNRSYREILDEIKEDVSVRALLPVLVSRGVKDRFAERRPSAR